MLEKAREDRAQGLLLVPDWPECMMMLEVRGAMEARELELVKAMRPTFECPLWFNNLTFWGVAKFDMLVFMIVF